jgi:hypothetical protein
MHNIGKLTYAQHLAIKNGRATKDIPGLTLGQRLYISRHREREEHSGEESQPQAEAGALLGEEQEGSGVRYVGVDHVPAGEAGEDQEAPEEGLEAPKPAPRKRRVPRKKG